MNANRHFEDEDLALYAMHLLAPEEASDVARELARSETLRARLAEVQAQLGAFAQTAVPLQPIPAGSLDRFRDRLSQTPRSQTRSSQVSQGQAAQLEPVARPVVVPAATPVPLTQEPQPIPIRRSRPWVSVVGWAGWAVAAALAVTVARIHFHEKTLGSILSSKSGQVANLASDKAAISQEHDALSAEVTTQAAQITQLTSDAAGARAETNTLRAGLAAAGSRLEQETARLQQATARLSSETARLDQQNALTATAIRDRDIARATVAAQATQVAQLTTEAARARQVLDALTDRSALRVTLVKPRSKPAPTGRATYVQSRGTLLFLAGNLDPLEAGKTYQLWLLPADGGNPVPAGTFLPDARGNASIVQERFPRAVAAKGFAVTIENQGGATTPTLPLILAGASGA